MPYLCTMCGRYSNSKVRKQEEHHYDATGEAGEETTSSYNIAPTQAASVITLEEPKKIQRFKWGLIPSRTPSHEKGAPIINARIETLTEKPSFAPLIEQRRCIVLTDGYYEWKRTGKTIIPYRIHFPGNGLFACAGLWDEWRDATGKFIKTFTIITLPAHPKFAHIHDRMPAILPAGNEKLWLKGSRPAPDLLETFRQYAGNEMQAYTVSEAVNKPNVDGPELWKPKSFNEPKVQGDLFSQ